MSGRATSDRGRAFFDVWPTPVGSEDLDALRGKVREAAKRARREFERGGCRAAHYRLDGEDPLDRICVRRLPHNFRMLIAFPSEREVTILSVGERLSRKARKAELKLPAAFHRDVYARLYASIGLDVPMEVGNKPECCEGDEAPVAPELVDRFIERSRQLRKEARRQSRRR